MSQVSSYEVVRRAIEFDNPPRLPLRFLSLGVSDVHDFPWHQTGTGLWSGGRESIDEWGCKWVRTEAANMGQVKGHPLPDLSAMDNFNWPDPNNPTFYEGMEKELAGSEGKYVLTSLFMFLFERIHALHGMQETLMDLYVQRDRIAELADRIVQFNLGIIENISRRFPGQVHGMCFSDDWGTERATLIHPDIREEFFNPRHQTPLRACQ